MSREHNIQFIENKTLQHSDGKYVSVVVDVSRALKSWSQSMYSHEWLDQGGNIKPLEKLSPSEKPKRETVEQKIKTGEPIEKPLLGIGIRDNVEIGLGRAEFLTLAAHGVKNIPVHIPKSNLDDFKDYLADVNS